VQVRRPADTGPTVPADRAHLVFRTPVHASYVLPKCGTCCVALRVSTAIP
jgi:hypothetical protein